MNHDHISEKKDVIGVLNEGRSILLSLYPLLFHFLPSRVSLTNDAPRAALLGIVKRGPDWWVEEGGPRCPGPSRG
jgi:hypothetical protein